MKKQVEKKTKVAVYKTAALFNNFAMQSNDIFIHCSRIPDVMTCVIKAREVLKKYKISPPDWMFGLVHKGETPKSPEQLHLMSFLMGMGLYNRMVRLIGMPNFLIGNSQALLVSAKVRTFEKMVINIFCGVEFQDYLRVYQKKTGNTSQFSLLHFSEKGGDQSLQSITKEYNISRCILISPSSCEVVKRKSATPTLEGLIEMDPQLAWFWPILKRNQLGKKWKKIFFSSALDTVFRSC